MDDFQSMPVLLLKVKETETQSEKSRKLLNSVCVEVLNVKDEIQELCKRLIDAKLESSSSYDYLHLQKYEWKNMVNIENLLHEVLPEKQQALENEKVELEEIQNTVWQERENFCDHVLRFSEKYGALATLEQPQVKTQLMLEKSADTPAINELAKEIIELKKEHHIMHLKLIACDTQVGAQNQELSSLMNEHTVEQEFTRLDEAMTFTEQECEMTKAEISNLQSLLNKKSSAWMIKLPGRKEKNTSLRSVQPPEDKPVMRSASSKLCGTLQKLSTKFPSTYDEKAVEYATAEQTEYKFTPKKPGRKITKNYNSSSQDPSKINSSKTGVHLKNVPVKGKNFMPKTPSTFSRKLKSSKDDYSILENEMFAILASPTSQANTKKSMRTAYSTETSSSREERVQPEQSSSNILFTSTQNYKSKEVGEGSTNCPQNMFTPYVT